MDSNQVNPEINEAIQPAAAEAETPKHDLQPGEKGFSIIFFLAGLFFFLQSLSLWGQMNAPKIASAAALPLFTSGVWTLLMGVTILENIRKSTPLSKLGSFGEIARKGLQYAFPNVVGIILAAIVVYCFALLLGLSFYIATPIFLWASMSYLRRKGYVLNILVTGGFLIFVYLIFQKLMGVILP